MIIITTINGLAINENDYDLYPPPHDIISALQPFDLYSVNIMDFPDFCNEDLLIQKEFRSNWSTVNNLTLDSLDIDVIASSSLKNYEISKAFDKKQETTWAEGANDDGIKQWIAVNIQAYKDVVYSTPFNIESFAIIPGYLKDIDRWRNNNRVKEAFLLIYSPDAPPKSEYRYVLYRLHMPDKPVIHVFDLGNKIPVSVLMFKKCWFIINDVYKGLKYRDTCISEMVFSGRCAP